MWRLFFYSFVVLAAASACGQSGSSVHPQSPQTVARPSPLLPYAGTWSGSFNGKPWLVLRLQLQGEQLTGSLQHARDIQLNDNGEIKSVSDEIAQETVQDAKVNPDGLLLSVKDPASQETDRYMMRLTGEATAEIKMIAMTLPPGMPKPKPWKLTKDKSAAVAPAPPR